MSAESESPNIAYLTGEYPKASHTFILREIAALRRQGARVSACSVRRPDRRQLIGAEEADAAAETFYLLETARRPFSLLSAHGRIFLRSPLRYFGALRLALRTGRPGLRGFVWQIFYFAEAGVLAWHLRRSGADHLHNHFADSSASVAMLAAELADIPFSFTLHGPAELFEPRSWHLGTKVARSAFTVCISHFARSQAMLFSEPEHWGKLRIVHCGVEPRRYDGPPPVPRDGLRLVFVGRLTPIKGLRVLFEAMAQVRARNARVALALVGDGEDREAAEREAKRIGDIEILGFRSQDEVSEALRAADAFVLPSFAEGVPVVLMEAMAAARPVIATRVGGVSELVEHGVSGRLVAPGDAEGLAQAILALADDPDSWARMGLEGREKVKAEFDLDTEARRLLALFRCTGGAAARQETA